MKVVDIANEIMLENSATDTNVAAIAYWTRSNIGRLNNLLYEDFIISTPSYEILDADGVEISPVAASIIKAMYRLYRADLDIRANLNAINTDSIISATDEGFSIKKINRSELLKSLVTLKKDTHEELTRLTHYYHSLYGAPSQVAGDDTVEGIYPHNYNAYERMY